MTRAAAAAVILFCGATIAVQAEAADSAPSPKGHPPPQRSPLSGICVLSRDIMLATADVASASNLRLRQLRDEAQAETDRDRAAIQADIKAVQEEQAGLSPTLQKQLADRAAERTRNVAAKVSLRTRELERTRQQVTQQIEAAAAPIIRELSRLNGCTLLLTRESVIDAPGMVDLTQVVITTMNARLRPIPFQRLPLTDATSGDTQ